MKIFSAFAFIAAAAFSAFAADISVVAGSAKSDLEIALQELAVVRQEIESERLPLARNVRALEQQVMDARRDLERSRRSQENQLVELNVLKAEVKHRSDQVKFAEALLAEYLRAFETRIHISEVQRYRGVIDAAKEASASAESELAEKLERQGELLHAAVGRIETALGGDRFSGRALTPGGQLESGTYLLAGPIAYFSSSQSGAAGIAELQLGSPEPAVLALPPEFTPAIQSLASTGKGEAPIDPSMGNALKIAATKDSLFAHMRKGGPVMIPILLLGCASLFIFVTRWLVIGRIRVATPADLQVILSALRRSDRTKATAHASSIKGPVGDMLHAAIDHCRERKEYIEEVMYERMIAARPKLEKLLPFLALSAAAAPLLGLLGTVTGMINTFNMITVFGTGDPKTLAGGISEALITTEFGLVVAIPSLLLHAVLSRRVKGVLASMEQTTVAFINGVPSAEEIISVRNES